MDIERIITEIRAEAEQNCKDQRVGSGGIRTEIYALKMRIDEAVGKLMGKEFDRERTEQPN